MDVDVDIENDFDDNGSQRGPLEYGEVSFFPLDDFPSVSHYWRQAVITGHHCLPYCCGAVLWSYQYHELRPSHFRGGIL